MATDDALVDAYTAGALDADGSIGLYQFADNAYLSAKVYIAGQDIQLMDFLRKHYGGTVQVSQRVYMWRPNNVVPFLERMLPYLITKRENAELILAWRKISRTHPSSDVRQSYAMQSKVLNSRVKNAFTSARTTS